MRVSGGDLCAAEAPIEPAGETKDASKFGAQSEGRDLISGSLTKLSVFFIIIAEGINMKKTVIIISCLLLLASAVIAVRIATPENKDYAKVEARLTQRTDYTEPNATESGSYMREYVFIYSYNGTEHHGIIKDDDPDEFPLPVGDKTTVYVNKEHPDEIVLPDRTAPKSFIDYVVRYIIRDKNYRSNRRTR